MLLFAERSLTSAVHAGDVGRPQRDQDTVCSQGRAQG
jgi:hypothetical protein